MLDTVLTMTMGVLSWLPGQWPLVVALPVLFLAVNLVLVWLIRLCWPLVGPVVGGVVRWLLTAAGLVLLLPEFLITRLVRFVGRPPSVIYVYGEVIERTVSVGGHAVAALLQVVEEQKARRAVALLAVLVWLFVSNQASCAGAPAGCVAPASRWWSAVTQTLSPGQSAPAPTQKPTPSKTPKSKH